jgi:hypothetical protein
MTVDTFDPSAMAQPIDVQLVEALCSAAVVTDDDELTLAAEDASRFAVLATHVEWQALAAELADDKIIALIKIFTLGEMQFSSWAAADKSPVVPLVQALKQRGVYQAELTRWIKAHSTNRFLPHGNLLNRL